MNYRLDMFDFERQHNYPQIQDIQRCVLLTDYYNAMLNRISIINKWSRNKKYMDFNELCHFIIRILRIVIVFNKR